MATKRGEDATTPAGNTISFETTSTSIAIEGAEQSTADSSTPDEDENAADDDFEYRMHQLALATARLNVQISDLAQSAARMQLELDNGIARHDEQTTESIRDVLDFFDAAICVIGERASHVLQSFLVRDFLAPFDGEYDDRFDVKDQEGDDREREEVEEGDSATGGKVEENA